MSRNIFFIDGTALIYDVIKLWEFDGLYKSKTLDLKRFSKVLEKRGSKFGNEFVRAHFYFGKRDTRTTKYVKLPDHRIPGEIDHIRIDYCENFDSNGVPPDERAKLSPKFADRFPKQEKGLDVQLVCDATNYALRNAADNYFFVIRDRDYIPLCRLLREVGKNVYLISSSIRIPVPEEILTEVDYYLTLDTPAAIDTKDLDACFDIQRP